MNDLMLAARAAFLTETQMFDAKWYLERCAEIGPDIDPMSHYLTLGSLCGMGPNAWVDGLQREVDRELACREGEASAQEYLNSEMKLVMASGLFDPEYYLRNNPGVEKSGDDPLRHFCQIGWRELRNPHPDFDVWWYWSSYMSPASEALNPLVHHILIGQVSGYPGRPPVYAPTSPGHDLFSQKTVRTGVRRVCLFAGYDVDGLVDDYVVAWMIELSKFADIYYLADCPMQEGELDKLRPYTVNAWAYRHGTYDFGSWARLAGGHVGWDAIGKYDELLLINDSGYLLGGLSEVFEKMQSRACDWWGLQATKGMHATRNVATNRFRAPVAIADVRANRMAEFREDYIPDFLIGSYFMAFRQPVIRDAGFRHRLGMTLVESLKSRLVRKYEIGLTQYLLGMQFVFDTFMDHLYPMHPVYSEWHFQLIKKGFPLFKRLFVVVNHYHVPDLANWKKKLLAVAPHAPIDQIERNLLRVGDHDKLHRSFSIQRQRNGSPSIPKRSSQKDFRLADDSTPKHEHWWAFAADPFTGALGGSQRAVFEQVRYDASIKKILLTRWRRLDFDGENIVVAPLLSPDGEHLLLRAKNVFVTNSVQIDLVFPVSESSRNIFNLGQGMGPGGLPSHDLVECDRGSLPEDLRREKARVLESCNGRRLLLYIVNSDREAGSPSNMFPESSILRFHEWLRNNNFCLAVRGGKGADVGGILDAFCGPDVFVLPERGFPHIEVALRIAAAVIIDSTDSPAGVIGLGIPIFRLGIAAGDAEQSCRGLDSLQLALNEMVASTLQDADGLYGQKRRRASGAEAYGNARGALKKIMYRCESGRRVE